MAVRVTTYQHAFALIGMKVDERIKKVLSELEKEGHSEKSICFSIWKSQEKLCAFSKDNRFIGILKNEILKYSWPKGDSRWEEYWKRKNEEKRAVAIRKAIDDTHAIEKTNETIDKTIGKKNKRIKGYIYFVQGLCGGAIKIGYSKQPDVRLKDLQTGYPDTLTILFMLPGDETIEHGLHKEFEFCRLKGEWFRPDPLLIKKIQELKIRQNYAQSDKQRCGL